MIGKSRNVTARYINLDRSHDRRLKFERSIETIGLQEAVKRFSALSGDSRSSRISQPELGCFLSHQSVLDEGSEDSYLLVFEDDAILNKFFDSRIAFLLGKIKTIEWDILFLGQTPDFRNLARLKALLNLKHGLGNIHREDYSSFKLLDGIPFVGFGCFAYIINKNSRAKIKYLIQNAARDGYAEPIDNLYARLIRTKRLSAKIVFPFIVGLDISFDSTIRKFREADSIHVTMAKLFWADTSSYNHDADASIISDAVYRWLNTR